MYAAMKELCRFLLPGWTKAGFFPPVPRALEEQVQVDHPPQVDLGRGDGVVGRDAGGVKIEIGGGDRGEQVLSGEEVLVHRSAMDASSFGDGRVRDCFGATGYDEFGCDGDDVDALLQVDKAIFQVKVGNHIGQNFGRSR